MANFSKDEAYKVTYEALQLLKIAQKQYDNPSDMLTLSEDSPMIAQKEDLYNMLLLVKRAKQAIDEFNPQLTLHTNVNAVYDRLTDILSSDFSDSRTLSRITIIKDEIDEAIMRMEYFLNGLK